MILGKRLALGLGLVAAVGVLAYGCCDTHGSARCGTPAAETIASLAVTTVTGTDGTDANIYFCIVRASSGAPECFDLDTARDDFEAHQTDTFTVSFGTPIAIGDLRGFYIENRGGGVFGNNWDLVGLRVEATGISGARWDIYTEPSIGCGDEQVDSGATWRPVACAY